MFDPDDDDLDFVPSTGSKLAAVFGLEKSAGNNKSLFYVPPKQPRQPDAITTPKSNTATKPAGQTPKFSVVIAEIVHSFKLEGDAYQDQKRVGVAILGNPVAPAFQLLLYKTSLEGKQEYIAVAHIITDFRFIVQPENYCSFYDDKKQYWSLVFNNQDLCMQFSRQIGAARFRASRGALFVTQLLCPGKSGGDEETADKSKEGLLEITFSHQPIDAKIVQLYTPIPPSEKMSIKPATYKWSEGLVEAAPGSSWSIFVPCNSPLPWSSDSAVGPTAVEVHVEKRIPPTVATPVLPLPHTDKEKVVSSSEEGSVQAKGISLTESLSNTSSSKAKLISRVARMGQPTLPLKGAVFCNPTDSEDTENEVDSAQDVGKPPGKPKFPKGRSSVGNRHQSSSGSTHPAHPAKMMPNATNASLWRPVATTSESTVVQYVPNEGQIMSVAPSSVPFQLVANSPTDAGQVSMLISESRMQNTEMRMNLGRVVDKLDSLASKVDALAIGSPTRSAPSPAPMTVAAAPLEAAALLSSVEKLVHDKQSLTAELADKTQKLNELNERVFSLVDTNTRILEQNTVLLEERQKLQQTDAQAESSQAHLLHTLESEKAALDERIAQQESRIKELESSLKDLEHEKAELQAAAVEEKVKQKDAERKLQTYADDNSELKDLVTSLSTNIMELESSIASIKQSQSEDKSAIQRQLAEEKSTYQRQLTEEKLGFQRQLTELKREYEEKVAQLKRDSEASHQAKDVRVQDFESTVTDMKILMNKVYRKLSQHFEGPQTFPGPVIKQAIANVLRCEVADYTDQIVASRKHRGTRNEVEVPQGEAQVEVSAAKALEASKAESKRGTDASASENPAGKQEGRTSPQPSVDTPLRAQPPEPEPWRQEPPPVPKFDEEEDDDWLKF